jgi:hypothetical protein
VTTNDPVPEADRLEQELPLADTATDVGIDAERSEPLDDDAERTGRGG